MKRRLKPDHLRMDTDLRIPMTAEQKSVIDEATSDEPDGKAAWARAILLDAAKRKLTRVEKQNSRSS